MEYLGLLFVFGSILFLAYITTKFVGKKTVRTLKGKYINIIESVSIGMDKQLHLVKIADQFVLIATSVKNVEFLTNVNIEEYVSENVNENSASNDFKNILEKYLPNMNVNLKMGGDIRSKSENKDSHEHSKTFSTNLTKLKNITSTVEEVSVKDRDGDINEF